MEPINQIPQSNQQIQNTENLLEQSNRTVSFKLNDPMTLPQDKLQCVICMTEFQKGDELESLPCIHLFHKECINQWFKESNKCPLCKTFIQLDNPPNNFTNSIRNVRSLRENFEGIERTLENVLNTFERTQDRINILCDNIEIIEKKRKELEERKKREEYESKIKKLNELQKEYKRLQILKQKLENK